MLYLQSALPPLLDIFAMLAAGMLGVFGLVAYAMRPASRQRALPRGMHRVSQAELDEATGQNRTEDPFQTHAQPCADVSVVAQKAWPTSRAEDAPSVDVLYVAGPFSALTLEGIQANIAEAVAFGQEVRALGALPLVPHLAILHTDDYEAAMRECFELIRRADAVILMPNWQQSPGSVRERHLAKARGMVVFESLEAYRLAVEAMENMEVARAVAS